MAALIIPNQTTFGAMTNQIVSRAGSLNSLILRLSEACATASAGYEGTPGTQFEAAPAGNMGPTSSNNFGVVPDPDAPGTNGVTYRYAVDSMKEHWDTFWKDALPYLQQLDNGTPGF